MFVTYAFLFLIGEATIDGMYSLIMADYPDTQKAKDRRFIAKFAKTLIIAGALLLYGNMQFALTYIALRFFIYDFLLSFIRFGKLQPLNWYLENHILVRAYQFIKRRF